jgi:hypothetical protein
MSLYDDFPSRKKVLKMKDINEIQQMVFKIDAAMEHMRDIQKYASNTFYGNNIANALICQTSNYTNISDCCDKERLKILQDNFRISIIQELERFIREEITRLKTEYSVLYEPKELRHDIIFK